MECKDREEAEMVFTEDKESCKEATLGEMLGVVSTTPKRALTEADIEGSIVTEQAYDLGRKTTAVVLTLANGFEVVGTSACVCPENYNREVGKVYARKRAIDKVWELEGYKLQSSLN